MLKSIWVSNFGSNLSFFKISNLKGSNFVKWQDDQNKSCRYWWVEQLLYSSLLHMKSFRVLKFSLNLSNFKFQILKCVKHCHIKFDVKSNLLSPTMCSLTINISNFTICFYTAQQNQSTQPTMSTVRYMIGRPTMCAKNLSNEEMTKIKVTDIHELNNFGIHHFLCWNQFGSQILVRTCRFSKFQIWKVQILSNDKMTKIKVVDINEFNNFGIYHFYVEIILGLKIWFELVIF